MLYLYQHLAYLHLLKIRSEIYMQPFLAIAMLKDKEPGTFVVRDSNSFPGAFGLALKVSFLLNLVLY
jgi:hypothetical protein